MGTIGTSCRLCLCLNARPPTPSTSKTTKPNNTQLMGWSAGGDQIWRSQCVIGMACVIMGMEMATNVNAAAATQMLLALPEPAALDYEKQQRGSRWSDKRTCPPWRVNSLETIVPENLPRPSARRRWESVGQDGPTKNAPDPAVKVVVGGGVNCFSM